MSLDVAPPNGFETNAGSFKPGRAAALAAFHSGRGGKAANRNAKRTAINAEAREARISISAKKVKAVDLGLPTPERMAKADAPAKRGAGVYVTAQPIELLFSKGKLSPEMACENDAMFMAARKLQDVFAGAGLSAGAQAQDLNRIVSGGGDPSSGMPLNEFAAARRKEFRIACTLMGWHQAFPFRGAGRLTVAVVCHEMGVKDAAAIYRPGGGNEAQLAKGMDVLREGLFALAVHWRFLRA